MLSLRFSREVLSELLGDVVEEFEGVSVLVALDGVGAVHADSEILGHLAGLDGLDHRSLEAFAPLEKGVVLVELGAVHEAAGPSVDRSDGVGRGLTTLLVDTVVTCNSAVGGLSLTKCNSSNCRQSSGPIWDHRCLDLLMFSIHMHKLLQ